MRLTRRGACHVDWVLQIDPAEPGDITWNIFRLSCGHEATTHDEDADGECPAPQYCPVCGARVVKK